MLVNVMMSRHKRQKRGDRIFRKWVLPILKKHYPGRWQSTSGTSMDYLYCIDWLYDSPEGEALQFASRSWMSKPYQHHSTRYKRSTKPHLKLETEIMIANLKKNKFFPDKTIEAWIHRGWVYIAISDSRELWTTIKEILENNEQIKTFSLRDPVGHTKFLQIPFTRLPNEPDKIVDRAIGWTD